MLLTIHAYNIEGFVRLKSKFVKYLNKVINEKFYSINNFSKICGVNRKAIEGLCQRSKRHKGFIKISRLFRITDSLGLDRNIVEKQIRFYKDSKTGAYNRVYQIKFPYVFTPLAIRVIAHLIGDGSVYETHLRYTQQNVNYIKELSENITNTTNRLKKTTLLKRAGSFKEEAFHIPMVLAKCICYILAIDRNQLKSSVFLEKCLDLPREYRVQVLAAIFVDDGCIKSHSIGMTDEKIIISLCRLIDSLGYKRGGMTSEERQLRYKGKPYTVTVYQVRLYIEGLRDFLMDIKRCINKYGHLAGLFNKQKALEERILRHNYRMGKIHEINVLKDQIIDLLKDKNKVGYNEIISRFNINPNTIRYILKKLVEKEIIVRVSRGVYSYAKNK